MLGDSIDREIAKLRPPPDHQTTEPSQNVIKTDVKPETEVGLPWAADSCPWVGKLRTVLPISDAIRDSAVHLVLTHHLFGG